MNSEISRKTRYPQINEAVIVLALASIFFMYCNTSIHVYRNVQLLGLKLLLLALLAIGFSYCSKKLLRCELRELNPQTKLWCKLILLGCFIVVSMFMINGFQIGGLRRVVPWIFACILVAITLPLPWRIVEQAAISAALAYGIFYLGRENQAVYNIQLLGLILLGGRRFKKLLIPTIGIYMINARWIDNDSGLIAGFVALCWLLGSNVKLSKISPLNGKLLLTIAVALGFFFVSYLPSSSSVSDRLEFYRWFIAHWSWENLLLGVGPGQVYELDGSRYPHLHCMPLTLLYEFGLIGVLYGGALIAWIGRSFALFSKSSQALFLAYGFWSLVDEPLQLMGGLGIFLCALTERAK